MLWLDVMQTTIRHSDGDYINLVTHVRVYRLFLEVMLIKTCKHFVEVT